MNKILLAIGLCILGLSLVLLFLYKKIATKFNWSTDVLEGLSISGIVVGGLAVLWGLFGGGSGGGSESKTEFAKAKMRAALLTKRDTEILADTAVKHNNWLMKSFAGKKGT